MSNVLIWVAAGDLDCLRYERLEIVRIGSLVKLEARNDASPHINILICHEFSEKKTTFSFPNILEFKIGSTRLGCSKQHPRPIQGIDGSSFLKIIASFYDFQECLVDNPVPVTRNTWHHELLVKTRINLVDRCTDQGVHKPLGDRKLLEYGCDKPLAAVICKPFR